MENEPIIKDMKKALFGNGQQGLVKDVTQIQMEMTEVKADLSTLASSYSALAKSQLEQDVTDRIKAETSKNRSGALKSVGIVFSIVSGTVFLVLGILKYIS